MTANPSPHPAERATIPARLVFVWFGTTLPLFAEIALRSAAHHNPNAQLVLYHQGLSASEQARMGGLPRCQLCPVDFERLLSDAVHRASVEGQAALNEPRLRLIWSRLTAAAARANLVRLLALYSHGGIYLDTDTLTLRNFEPLLQLGAFCGQEHILWPKEKLNRRTRYFWLEGPLLTAMRQALAHVPRGYAVQRRLLRRYSLAVNNAVLGCAPGHPAFHQALAQACLLSDDELTRRFRLGTHLLQSVFGSWNAIQSEQPVRLLSPNSFYPLGPVLSNHYFREVPNVEVTTSELVPAESYVIHWYASVSSLATLDAAHIWVRRARTPFAHLCAPYVTPVELGPLT